jgi:hypothetical protein
MRVHQICIFIAFSPLRWISRPAALDLPILRKKIQIDIQNPADSLRRISPAALDLLILRKKKYKLIFRTPLSLCAEFPNKFLEIPFPERN